MEQNSIQPPKPNLIAFQTSNFPVATGCLEGQIWTYKDNLLAGGGKGT